MFQRGIMNWMIIAKQKAEYLPLVYILVATPGLLGLVGTLLLIITGIAQFYPEYNYPTDFAMALVVASTAMSGGSFLLFRYVLNLIVKQPDVQAIVNIPRSIEENLSKGFAPFLNQLKAEQTKLIETIKK